MYMTVPDAYSTITPLRLIFWGGLLCIFDFSFRETVNGSGWTFDILNDFVGMLMITSGVFGLDRVEVHAGYSNAMSFLKVIAVLGCFDAFHGHFIYDVPPLLSFLLVVLGLFTLAATIVFCVAMRWLCIEGGLAQSAGSWTVTMILFVVIYCLPLGIFNTLALLAMVTGSSFHINLGPLGLILIFVFAIPVIHLFISTSRMKSEAERLVY